jgi:hypothetical protein
MCALDKSLWQLATTIRESLNLSERHLPDLPVYSWNRARDLVRQIRAAELRGWQLAAHERRSDLAYSLTSLQQALSVSRDELLRAPRVNTTPAVGEVYRDLAALEGEFASVTYGHRTTWLSVTTEPIELEGIYLGPFEIRLTWDGTRRPTYRVTATDPHPAVSREGVTHPHVCDEVLCEGDAHTAIAQALAQGRVLDFFTLVAGVLQTYNPESPFVALEHWSGQRCADCGALVDDEELFVCQQCDLEICDECQSACADCARSFCSSCLSHCGRCDEDYCRQCLTPCASCRTDVCSNCRDDHQLCGDCHENQSEAEAADTSIFANRVGPAALSAGCRGN